MEYQQPIHKKIQREFSRFVEANREWIDEINEGQIIQLPDDIDRKFKLTLGGQTEYSIYNINLLDHPYTVRYVGVLDHGEGTMIVFMDDNMDKVYSHYDVIHYVPTSKPHSSNRATSN